VFWGNHEFGVLRIQRFYDHDGADVSPETLDITTETEQEPRPEGNLAYGLSSTI